VYADPPLDLYVSFSILGPQTVFSHHINTTEWRSTGGLEKNRDEKLFSVKGPWEHLVAQGRISETLYSGPLHKCNGPVRKITQGNFTDIMDG
jgi:hypothetical protein